jgi:hypothetical protein
LRVLAGALGRVTLRTSDNNFSIDAWKFARSVKFNGRQMNVVVILTWVCCPKPIKVSARSTLLLPSAIDRYDVAGEAVGLHQRPFELRSSRDDGSGPKVVDDGMVFGLGGMITSWYRP